MNSYFNEVLRHIDFQLQVAVPLVCCCSQSMKNGYEEEGKKEEMLKEVRVMWQKRRSDRGRLHQNHMKEGRERKKRINEVKSTQRARRFHSVSHFTLGQQVSFSLKAQRAEAKRVKTCFSSRLFPLPRLFLHPLSRLITSSQAHHLITGQHPSVTLAHRMMTMTQSQLPERSSVSNKTARDQAT